MSGIGQIEQQYFDDSLIEGNVDKVKDINIKHTTIGMVLDALTTAFTKQIKEQESAEDFYNPNLILPDGPYPLGYVAEVTSVGFKRLQQFIKEGILIAYKFNANQTTMVTKEDLYDFVEYLQKHYPDDGMGLKTNSKARADYVEKE